MSVVSPETNQSIWTSSSTHRPFPSLAGEQFADVVIVGGGITGLSAALCLADSGTKVILLEANTIGSGTTGASTGNLYVPVDKYLHTIQSRHNEEVLTAVAQSRNFAIARILEWIRTYNIDCDLQRVPWHLFTTRDGKQLDEQIVNEFKAARHIDLPVSNQLPDKFPFDDVSAITSVEAQAQIDPLKYVRGLAAVLMDRIQIFENTRVDSVDDGEPCKVSTRQGSVTAHEVVMATHTPKGIYSMHAEMEAKREYVLVAKLRKGLPAPAMYWHLTQTQHISIRPCSTPAGDFLLVLGGAHLVGEPADNAEKIEELEHYLRSRFDVDSIVLRWGAQNYSSADGLPFIGNSPLQKHVHIATGFAADGLVYGTLAGYLINETIAGRDNAWSQLYSPRRFNASAAAPGVLKENINVVTHLLIDHLFYRGAKEFSEILPGDGKTMKLDGEKIAAHRDHEGQLHVVSAVCPHMGCLVHWNNAEKSWDCPCHGSRFSVQGDILEGPAFNGLARPAS